VEEDASVVVEKRANEADDLKEEMGRWRTAVEAAL
jgi:hypothetical protein